MNEGFVSQIKEETNERKKQTKSQMAVLTVQENKRSEDDSHRNECKVPLQQYGHLGQHFSDKGETVSNGRVRLDIKISVPENHVPRYEYGPYYISLAKEHCNCCTNSG